ncbi:hypothetical protein F383_37055 [Gossypium arboreum]|uniref:Uncharacterized protein n=1 Tax=Gossypium arboreum TaxID=29729 RepID=A0A0B0MF84_GOSAR|nr:hypothetical protein F383_37055 [Gossypium arboreum]
MCCRKGFSPGEVIR